MSIDSAQSADRSSLGKNTDLAFSPKENPGEPSADDKRRAALQLRYDLQETAKYLGRDEKWGKRLRACMVVRVDNFQEYLPDAVPANVVVVERDDKKSLARYKNLVHCDSPWTCPVCSQRRTEEDKREVNKAYLSARSRGWTAIMVTYTQSHTQASNLDTLLQVNASARRRMKSGTRLGGLAWSDIRDRFGLVGGIINLEVTHGKNAWHPHNHELIFIDPEKATDTDMAALRWEMAYRWQNAIQFYGGDCDMVHGLHIRTGDDAISEYIAKIGHEPKNGWSVEHEMTKGASKIAKKDGRTPFQLLYDYRFEGDRQAGALFREFARHFSGKAHIRWSQGLRELLDMDNFVMPITEAEQAKQDAEKPEFKPFCALPDVCWRNFVLCAYGRRGALLLAAERGPLEVSELFAEWGYEGQIYWLSDSAAAHTPVIEMNANHASPEQQSFAWDVAKKRITYQD